MRTKFIILCSAAVLTTAVINAATAHAQSVCEIAGAAGSENTGGATAANPGDLACGDNATADGQGGAGATAVGTSANASGDTATAVGVLANATGLQSVAVGNGAQATSED